MSRSFEVTFYREIVGDNGQCRDMPIEVLEIARAGTPQAAVQAAIRQFEQDKRVPCWSNLATRFAIAEHGVQSLPVTK